VKRINPPLRGKKETVMAFFHKRNGIDPFMEKELTVKRHAAGTCRTASLLKSFERIGF
jgi:hypothetical protein